MIYSMSVVLVHKLPFFQVNFQGPNNAILIKKVGDTYLYLEYTNQNLN